MMCRMLCSTPTRWARLNNGGHFAYDPSQLGIDVLVEIDMPGHTDIVSLSHPDWVACSQASPWSTYAAEPPSGQLRFTTPDVVDFASSLVKAVASKLSSSYFSTGGDEINTACYDADEETQAALKASGQTFEEALSAFTQATHKAIIEEGKTPVVWEGEWCWCCEVHICAFYSCGVLCRDGFGAQRHPG